MEKDLHSENGKQKNTPENNRNTRNKVHYKVAQLNKMDIRHVQEK